MCLLFETIKVKNGQLYHLNYHNQRVNDSRQNLFGIREKWDLSELIKVRVPDKNSIYRCRFTYSHNVERIEFIPYSARIIDRLYLIEAPRVDYSYKYANRNVLDRLKAEIHNEPNADILIVINHRITDTSFSNIIFFDGNDWLTPDTPLLKGTKRAFYLDEGLIKEARIRVEDLNKYTKARLINAMLDFDSGSEIDIGNIRSL